MKHCAREALFREAVLGFLGIHSPSPLAGEGKASGSEEPMARRGEGAKIKYCLTCKKLKKDDCAKCEYKNL